MNIETKKFRRLKDRNIENFPDDFWREEYEFEGVPVEDYGHVEEYVDGKLVRIHLLEQLEEII